MRYLSASHPRILSFAITLCLATLGPTAYSQEQSPQQKQEADDVLRIKTELVQTSVMVFDRQGRFVDGLKPEQFELRVDDQPVSISFFERVVAGSAAEETQLRALTRGGSATSTASTASAGRVRGRTIIFFIDDLHLSLDSLGRTRAAISNFIEKKMSASDQVAIASASGQIGFLQQLTDNKAVLRAALARLKHIAYTVSDTEQPTMSEYMALKIEQKDRDALGYYIERCVHENRYTPMKCFEVVSDRARVIIQQAAAVTAKTLYGLENLMRSSEQLAGRKLVLLISDGFYLGALHRYGNAFDKLPQITDEARRHGVVIYTIDARGLISGQADATVNLVDGNGLLDRANLGEIPASQDALNALAGDTGGRALRNSNSITDWVTDTLRETSNYYLLAWRPVTTEQHTNKLKRISVRITGRPELTVRFAHGYLDSTNQPSAAAKNISQPAPKTDSPDTAASPAVAELQSALSATHPQHALSTLLSATFLDTPKNGLVLTVSTQVATNILNYGTDGREAATVDLAGVILNTDGKPSASFRTQLQVNSRPANQTNADSAGVIYNYRAPLAPGLYQVRVAAHERTSGRMGSAMQWVEIPDLKAQGLNLSSLLVGVQEVAQTQRVSESQADAPQLQFSVNHRFQRSSRLGFLVFIYNAARAANNVGAADLTAQVLVFNSSGRAVIESPVRPLATNADDDPARRPYAGAFPLQTLAPDQYVLRVIVTDRTTKTTAMREVNFIVE
jgi:VWFA-related protein